MTERKIVEMVGGIGTSGAVRFVARMDDDTLYEWTGSHWIRLPSVDSQVRPTLHKQSA